MLPWYPIFGIKEIEPAERHLEIGCLPKDGMGKIIQKEFKVPVSVDLPDRN